MLHNYREIYDSRSVLRSLIYKNLFGKYRNSILGFGWHFMTPIMMMIVYYIVFSIIRTTAMPNYWLYIATGLFPFNFMLTCLTSGAGTIVNNASVVKKIYFPREILVLSQVCSSLIVSMLGYIVVIVLSIVTQSIPNILLLLFVPLFYALMGIFVLGYCLIFSSLTVYLRDTQYVLSSISMAFFFLTPMYFTVNDISSALDCIIWLNPFTYYVESFHCLIYYGELPNTMIAAGCVILPIASIIIGELAFNKLKKGFADRL